MKTESENEMETELEIPLIERIIMRAEMERDPLTPLFERFDEFSRQLANRINQAHAERK